jgi:hypothetical protein
MSLLNELDAETRATLEEFGFNAALFANLQRQVRSGALTPSSNVMQGRIGAASSAR